MAGYVFLMGDENAMDKCIKKGYYSTNLSTPKNGTWESHHEGTFADFCSMKENDNVYFFMKRMIVGVGKLVNIKNLDCKFLNYPQADNPIDFSGTYDDIKKYMLLDEGVDSLKNRFICFFEPFPSFFLSGIDMDEALSSKPASFRMLRALERLSFIKIDDEENKALFDIILKRHENVMKDKKAKYLFDHSFHIDVESRINKSYLMSASAILESCAKGEHISHEMALEAGVIDFVTNFNDGIFGNWDYLTHQVIASPFKPIHYIDRMDIFGYRYIRGYQTISRYLVMELKKDPATIQVLDQIMKYVDWINHEYAFDDYSMIEAFIVAQDFPQEVIKKRDDICVRNFIEIQRPLKSSIWTNVRLIRYSFDSKTKSLHFEEVIT